MMTLDLFSISKDLIRSRGTGYRSSGRTEAYERKLEADLATLGGLKSDIEIWDERHIESFHVRQLWYNKLNDSEIQNVKDVAFALIAGTFSWYAKPHPHIGEEMEEVSYATDVHHRAFETLDLIGCLPRYYYTGVTIGCIAMIHRQVQSLSLLQWHEYLWMWCKSQEARGREPYLKLTSVRSLLFFFSTRWESWNPAITTRDLIKRK